MDHHKTRSVFLGRRHVFMRQSAPQRFGRTGRRLHHQQRADAFDRQQQRRQELSQRGVEVLPLLTALLRD